MNWRRNPENEEDVGREPIVLGLLVRSAMRPDREVREVRSISRDVSGVRDW